METETLLEKRTSPRKPMRGRGEISAAISDGKWPVDMLDISAGGISFLSASPFAKDSMWLVRLELNEHTVRGVVCIVYCVKHSLTDAYRVGVAFKNLEEQYQDVINRYLEEA
jgi:c-di-GMP-binding flagellar brake protein YcgR